MSENQLVLLSKAFAVAIINICEKLRERRKASAILNQLLRSGTSIGANVHEANYAHGKSDFIAKFQIALKECYETEYWLELFVKAEIVDRETVRSLYNQCGTIRRILIASINTTKEHLTDIEKT